MSLQCTVDAFIHSPVFVANPKLTKLGLEVPRRSPPVGLSRPCLLRLL